MEHGAGSRERRADKKTRLPRRLRLLAMTEEEGKRRFTAENAEMGRKKKKKKPKTQDPGKKNEKRGKKKR